MVAFRSLVQPPTWKTQTDHRLRFLNFVFSPCDNKYSNCFHYRHTMANWTPDHSTSLSLLLDDVVGTKEMIDIRQNYCRIRDCLKSHSDKHSSYFTGSKSEGLDLPGSDEDFMFDINNICNIKIIQSSDEMPQTPCSTWLMCVENVPPGFALLQYVHHNSNFIHPFLITATYIMNGLQYLSSDCTIAHFAIPHNFLSNFLSNFLGRNIKIRRQGPSLEHMDADDSSKEGRDFVNSIRCTFWPFIATEWPERQRHYGWPNSRDISTITEFGCHLVAVGHPHSDTKLMQWRISFSVAERTLVWSFNHVQMQCYAIMKIVLKEFIKVRCSPQNQILCSYFIKTFLFWKYETNEQRFWRANNLRECIKYVLTEFSKCVREGVLPHYFIPSFNLLSVKLTRAAQIELLQLIDIIIQSDISIVNECRTFKNIWSDFLRNGENKNDIIYHVSRRNILKDTKCMMDYIVRFDLIFFGQILRHVNGPLSFKDVMSIFASLSCNTVLKGVLVKRYIFHMQINSLIKQSLTNKSIYQIVLMGTQSSIDISTCKLWCAILLCVKTGYTLALKIIYNILASIPPFALYYRRSRNAIGGYQQLYVDVVLDSNLSMMQRARKAWLFEIYFMKDMIDLVPLGIQIELYFCEPFRGITLSPYVCTYYLQFLCYHEMRQYDNRDRALQQLVDAAFSLDQMGSTNNSVNLAGHCLLVAGERSRAKNIFWASDLLSKMTPQQKYNSAAWYLRNFF